MSNVITRWSQSIYFRVILVVVIVLAFALVAVGIGMSVVVDQEVGDFKQVLERARVMSLGQVFGDIIESGNLEDFQAAVDSASNLDGWKILFTDSEGRLIDVTDERSQLTPIEGFTVLSGGRNIGVVQYANSESTGTIAKPQWSQISSEVNQWLIVVGLATGCLGVLLVSLLLRRTLRPVRVLTTAARHLGEGDLSQRVPSGGHSELGLLSNTFNNMANGLEKAERQRRNLMADVAHELRTPLFNIQGHLEAIKDGVFEPDTETIGTIHQQVEHLTNLVEDVRTLALAESKKLKLDIQLHSIEEVLEHCIDDFRAQAELKGISLKVSIDPDIPKIPIDRTRISQVVGNLLQNAISHTPSGGEITILAGKTSHERLSISITDTGSGIPEESLPFVFDRFYRTDQSRTTDNGGSGLGLAIAKELVEAHGGIMQAENVVGRGSRFIFELPLSSPLEKSE